MPRALPVLLAAVLISAFSSVVQAQLPVPRDSATAMPRDSIPSIPRGLLTMDFTVGAAGLAGAVQRDRLLGTMDLSVGLTIHRFASGSLVLAATGSTFLSRGSACQAGTECRPLRTSSFSYGLLVGWEPWRGGRQDWRLLAGPTVFESEIGAHSGGMRARVDIAPPTARYLGLVASVGTAILADFEGSTAVMGTVGVGFRVR